VRRPIHPGNILRREFMTRSLSAAALARAVHVPANRIGQLIAGRRGITADTALRLGVAFGTTPEFWMNLQSSYELRKVERNARLMKEINTIKRI
jgi:antitoxin HigA-1